MYFTPGDAARIILGSTASQAQIDALKESLGLNDPYLVQLVRFLKQMFIDWDLGTSYLNGTEIMKDLVIRLPRTAILAGCCMLGQIVIALPLGVTAAVHQNKWQDSLCMLISLLGASVPSFWLALMLILLFATNLHWLPSFGIGSFKHWILPCITVAIYGIGIIARQTRSQMLEVIRSDYITTARAKGLSERTIRYKHALPNALIPVITGMGSAFGSSLGGSVVIETAFSIPGIGLYMVEGITNRDLPKIRGGVVFIAILFCVVILLIDLVYAFVDPRIKAQYEGKARGGKKNG
jgi:peptide/nickel transport system permease protein